MFIPYAKERNTTSVHLPSYSRVFTADGWLLLPTAISKDKEQEVLYTGLPKYSLLCIPEHLKEIRQWCWNFYVVLTSGSVVKLSDSGINLLDYVGLIEKNYDISFGQALTPYQKWGKWGSAHERFKRTGIYYLMMLMQVGDKALEDFETQYSLPQPYESAITTNICGIAIEHTEVCGHNNTDFAGFNVNFYQANLPELDRLLTGFPGLMFTMTVVSIGGDNVTHNFRWMNSIVKYVDAVGNPMVLSPDLTDATKVQYISVTFNGVPNANRGFQEKAKSTDITCISFIPDTGSAQDNLPVPVFELPEDEDVDFYMSIDKLDKLLDQQHVLQTDGVDRSEPEWRERYRWDAMLVSYGSDKRPNLEHFGRNVLPVRKLHLVVDHLDRVSKPKRWVNDSGNPPFGSALYKALNTEEWKPTPGWTSNEPNGAGGMGPRF